MCVSECVGGCMCVSIASRGLVVHAIASLQQNALNMCMYTNMYVMMLTHAYTHSRTNTHTRNVYIDVN